MEWNVQPTAQRLHERLFECPKPEERKQLSPTRKLLQGCPFVGREKARRKRVEVDPSAVGPLDIDPHIVRPNGDQTRVTAPGNVEVQPLSTLVELSQPRLPESAARQANGMRGHVEASPENLAQCRASEHAPSEDDVRSSPRVLELDGRQQ